MGCFPCFDSREEEKLNREKQSDDLKQTLPTVPSNISKLSSGSDRLRPRSDGGQSKRQLPSPKDAPGVNIAAQIFAFRELAVATKNFRPECFIGEGGFGRVYKGCLESTGQVVAVKQLDRNGLQGNREFLVEVLMLSLLHHPNLVNLIGYCADGDQRLLVYEFMPLGSLEDHLHGNIPSISKFSILICYGNVKCVHMHRSTKRKMTFHASDFRIVTFHAHAQIEVNDLPPEKEPLDWNTRMKIAAGAAKDPLLQGRYPMRGLYQALAVASMCIQEQAAARPLIGDVVTALSYLANQAYEPIGGHGHRGSGDRDEKRQRDERGGQLSRNEEGGGSGRRWDLDGSEKDDSPRETAKILNRDLDRERAVAEAKMWGENWREKQRQSAQGSFDGSNG
ncbi:hypothetical protein SADUNF_Sadunf01G0046500 [Salix dunnii]|uniref:Protein kinase domain-containing protein n=1 Tax=Salix dunnii TaxID=1413687 RepID=A0A835NA06_9ROSI|nr:hypothetical protein SADUNF_Sadunf01G0046500 [Salix dunnii]